MTKLPFTNYILTYLFHEMAISQGHHRFNGQQKY